MKPLLCAIGLHDRCEIGRKAWQDVRDIPGTVRVKQKLVDLWICSRCGKNGGDQVYTAPAYTGLTRPITRIVSK